MTLRGNDHNAGMKTKPQFLRKNLILLFVTGIHVNLMSS